MNGTGCARRTRQRLRGSRSWWRRGSRPRRRSSSSGKRSAQRWRRSRPRRTRSPQASRTSVRARKRQWSLADLIVLIRALLVPSRGSLSLSLVLASSGRPLLTSLPLSSSHASPPPVPPLPSSVPSDYAGIGRASEGTAGMFNPSTNQSPGGFRDPFVSPGGTRSRRSSFSTAALTATDTQSPASAPLGQRPPPPGH